MMHYFPNPMTLTQTLTMELKKKTTDDKKKKEGVGIYHYTYKIKNGEKVKFYGDDEIMKEFEIHHYGDGGTLYYRK